MTDKVISPNLAPNPYVPGSGINEFNQGDIQAAIYQALSEAPGMPPVYDNVPQDAAFPYVVIGDDISTPFDDDCGVGANTLVTIHVWSVYRGRQEVKNIMALIYAALQRVQLPLSNGYTVTCNFDWQHSMLDPDGVTRHGIIRFRLLTRSYGHG